MRNKIDLLVEDGIKPLPDCTEAEDIETMAKYLWPEESRILRDFANKLRQGKTLTEKQENFKSRLYNEAKGIKENGPWQPSKEEIAEMKQVRLLKKQYSSNYWYTHSMGKKAMDKLELYLDQLNSLNDFVPMSKKVWESAKHAVRGKFKLLKNPRFNVNDKCFVKRRDWNAMSGQWNHISTYGIICSEVYVNNSGLIVYDVLHSGNVTAEDNDNLFKRQ